MPSDASHAPSGFSDEPFLKAPGSPHDVDVLRQAAVDDVRRLFDAVCLTPPTQPLEGLSVEPAAACSPVSCCVDVGFLRFDDLSLLHWSGSSSHVQHVLDAWARSFSGSVEYLVARSFSGFPVAKLGLDFEVHPGCATVWQVASLPELQGLGLASLLFAKAFERAAARGVLDVRLSVEPDNVRALRLYEHLGFTVVGESTESWLEWVDDPDDVSVDVSVDDPTVQGPVFVSEHEVVVTVPVLLMRLELPAPVV